MKVRWLSAFLIPIICTCVTQVRSQTIDVGNHQANQNEIKTIQLFIQDPQSRLVDTFNFAAQIGGEKTGSPIFVSVGNIDGTPGNDFVDLLTGTIFSGGTQGTATALPRFLENSVVTPSATDMPLSAAPQLIATIKVDTAGVSNGRYGLKLGAISFNAANSTSTLVLNGTQFAPTIINGSIAIGPNPQVTWSGGGGGNNWSNSSNWRFLAAPLAGDSLIFSGATRLTPTNDITAGTNFNSLTFDNTAGAFTLTGNDLGLLAGGTVTNDSASLQTVNLNLTPVGGMTIVANGGNFAFGGNFDLSNGGVLNVDGIKNTAITGNITGSGGLAKAGAGTLTLSGANTYTGSTSVNAGTLVLNNGVGTGAIKDAGAVVLANTAGATLDVQAPETIGSLSGGGATGGTVKLNANTLTVAGGTSTVFAGTITNVAGGSLTRSGTGTLELAGANTYTGPTTVSSGTLNITGSVTSNVNVNGGTLVLGSDAAINAANILTVNGGTLQSGGGNRIVGNDVTVGGNFAITGANNLKLSGAVNLGTTNRTVTVTNNSEFSGAVTGTGGLSKAGAGTLTLSNAAGTNAYGTTTVNAGTLAVSGGNAIADTGAVTLANTAGATLALNANETIGSLVGGGAAGGTVNLNTNTLTVGDATSTNFAGAFTGTGGSLNKVGAGTFTLSGTSTNTGTTTINGGTLNLAGSLASNTTINNGGTLNGIGNLTGAANLLVTNGGILAPGNSIGQLGVGGNFTLDPNAIWNVEVASANPTSDVLNAGGAATFGTGSLLNVSQFGAGNIANGSTFTILNATGGITDIGLQVNSNIAFVDFTLAIINAGTQLQLTAATIDAIAWAGLGGDDNFTTGTNWTPANALPNGTTDVGNKTLAFTAGGNFNPNADAGPYTNVGGILFEQASGTYVIGGAGLGLSAAATKITNNSNNTQTINNALTIGAGGLTVNGASDTILGGNIDGGGGLTKQDVGTLTLNGANTYTGGTTLTSGTLILGNDAALGTGALQINGGTLQSNNAARNVGNAVAVGGDFAITGANALQLSGAMNLGTTTRTVTVTNNTTFSGILRGTAGFTKLGAGTLTFTGVNTYTGPTTVNAGTLVLNQGNGAIADTGAVTVGAAGTLTVNADETIGSLAGTAGAVVNLNGVSQLTIAGSTDTTFAGVLAGAAGGTLVQQGTGTLTLSGINTYTGPTTVNSGTLAITGSVTSNVNVQGGTLVLGNDTAIGGVGNPGGNTLTINLNGTLQSDNNARNVGNAITALSNFSITGTNDLQLSGALNFGNGDRTVTVTNNTTFSGILGESAGLGSTGLVKAGTGTLKLSGVNTYESNTTLQAGTLVLGNNQALGLVGSLVLQGGALQSDNNARNVANNSVFNSDLVVNAGNNLQLSGAMNLGNTTRTVTVNNTQTTFSGILSGTTGTTGLTKDGAGTLMLSGANTYTGTTTVNAGTLDLTGGNAIADLGAVNVTGGTLLLNNNETIGSLAGTGGTVDLQGNLLVVGNDNSSTTFAGLMTNVRGGRLTKFGTGTFTLTGANTYTGTTTLNTGTLALGNDTAIGSGGLVINGGTLQSTDNARNVGNAVNVGGDFSITGANNLQLSGAINLGTGTRTVTVENNSTFSGILSNGGLTKAGAGTLTLSGANTYAGNTTLNTGTLALGHDTALGTGGLTINGGTLQSTDNARNVGNAVTVGGDFAITGTNSLQLSGNMNLGNVTRTLTIENNSTFSGILSETAGIAGLTKLGAGTLTLNGINTYTGPTNVNAGILALNGQVGGLVNVNAGGTLMGTGAIGGNLFVNGGTLRPGNSIGTLNVAGNFNLGAAGTLAVELDRGNPLNADLLNIGGSATLALGSTIAPSFVGVGALTKGDLYTIIDTTGGTNTVTDNGANITRLARVEFTGEVNGGLYQLRILSIRNFVDATLRSVNPRIGNALEAAANAADAGNAQAGALVRRLENLTDTQLNQFVEEVNNGARTPSVTSDTVVDIVQAFTQTLTNYLAARRSGLPAFALQDNLSSYRGQPYGTPMLASAAPNSEALAYAVASLLGQNEEGDAQQPTNLVDLKLSVFAKVYGIFSDQNTISGRTGYQSSGVGTQVGIDYRINDQWLVGVVGGYSRTTIDLNAGLGNIDVNSLRIGPFVSYHKDEWFVDAALTYGYHDYDSTRNSTIAGAATSDYAGRDITAYLGGGYDITKGDLIITPTASLQYTHFRRDSYTESGVGALKFGAYESQTLHSRLGTKLAYVMHKAGMTIVPEILLGWEHEYLGDANDLEASFPGGGAFTVSTTSTESDSVFFGTGLTAIVNERFSTYLRYDGSGNSNGQTHAITGGVRLTF